MATMAGIRIEELIPHRGRMKLVDDVVEINDILAKTSSRVTERWPLDEANAVAPVILIELIAQVLQEAGVPPQCLELELTEAVAMKNPEAAAARIAALESQGVQLSIDDFGTGYSSLSYLKRFRLHKLKIDQSFVRELDHDTEDQAIVMAIIQLARSLGLRTLAEGVETPEQLAFLRQHGCQLVQGYHFSKPLPPAQLLDFVRQRSSAAPASSSSTSA